MRRIADLTWRHPKLVLAAVGLAALASLAFARDVEHHLIAAGFADPASESERATQIVAAELGYDANPGVVLLVRAPDGGRISPTEPATRKEIARIGKELAAVDRVGRVVTPLDRDPAAAGLVAEDGHSLLISAHLETADVESEGGEIVELIRPIAAGSDLDVSVAGFAAAFSEVNDETRADLLKAEMIAFPVLALFLLFVFRGVIAASIPLLIGVLSIVGTLLVLRVMSSVTDTSLFALNIATGLSLGLAVDYALLMVSRYREEMGRSGPTREAHRRTVETAGRTVLFSGMTVAAALIALIVFPQRFLYSMAVAGSAVGILAAIIAVLVVPSLLALLGKRIDSLSIRRRTDLASSSDGWYRLARGVMKRPVITALASAAFLLLAASPLLSTTLTGPSSEAVSNKLASYEATQYLADHYPRDTTEAMTVTVDGTASDTQLESYRQELLAVEGVLKGTPFLRASENIAYANFALSERALAGSSQDAVRQVREIAPPVATESLVSGNTARFVDQKQSLGDHAILVVAIIAIVTAILLFLLTGSVVLPLKTLLMNTLTLGATLGILVLAFERGLLAGPLDFSGPEAIEVTSLVFLFAVIFGLATDYAVLVMARIKERHDLGDPNEEAVAIGIARTGRVITAAAVAIALVFIAFSVSSIFFVKQIAIGMAVGVLLDATVVRAILVPSLMRLFGEWNWWAPAPLRRLHQRIGISESNLEEPNESAYALAGDDAG